MVVGVGVHDFEVGTWLFVGQFGSFVGGVRDPSVLLILSVFGVAFRDGTGGAGDCSVGLHSIFLKRPRPLGKKLAISARLRAPVLSLTTALFNLLAQGIVGGSSSLSGITQISSLGAGIGF